MRANNLTIAQSTKLIPITKIARKLGIKNENLILYGNYIAKVNISQFSKLKKQDGNLILVTSITPTKQGEGKTTVTIGIAQALAKLGKKAMICIRQPSMGPIFGIKGGACGGGFSQVLPMEDINLHFTGDIHAVGMAGNLLAAIIDNSIINSNKPNLDINNIAWKRLIDMNDRTLREIFIGCQSSHKGSKHNTNCLRHDHFDITAASEVMAILSLAINYKDLKFRLEKIIVGFTKGKNPVTTSDLHINGAMSAILKNAIHPNLVQSVEHVPAFVHGGAFGNVAHGCSSLIATKMALKLADYVVTEAGFGADLGGEKFFDIKCRIGNLYPSSVVLVVTVKALKMHGQGNGIKAIEKGFENLEKQIENVRKFNMEPLVAVNKFPKDKTNELKIVIEKCAKLGIKAFIIDVWLKGGNGALNIAEELIKVSGTKRKLGFLYDTALSVKEKIEIIAREMYGANKVNYTDSAISDLRLIERNYIGKLPICIAKTQKSLSDNPNLLGRPRNFDVTVTMLRVSAGAGFIVAYLGNILTMPSLPKNPNALEIDMDENGAIKGLF